MVDQQQKITCEKSPQAKMLAWKSGWMDSVQTATEGSWDTGVSVLTPGMSWANQTVS